MKKKLLVSLVSLFLNSHAIDLLETYQKAVSYNADYLKAIATNQAGIEQQNIAFAALLPQINATGTLNENYFVSSGMNAMYHQPVYAATLTQVVFDFSKFSTYTKGKFAAQLADLQLLDARQQLMLKVAEAYFNVLYASDTVLTIQMTKKALEKQMKQAQKAFSVGTVTVADVNDAEAAYDASSAQEIQEQNTLISKKNIFRNLTGINPEQIQPIEENIHLVSPTPESADAWSQIAESGNVNVKIAEKQMLMATEDVSIARAGHLPTLNLNAQYTYRDTAGIDNSNVPISQLQPIISIPGSILSSYGVGAIGLQLSIPIFSGGGISSRARQAIANLEAASEQLTNVRRQTDQNIRNSYWQVQNGVSLVMAQKAALKSAKTKLDSDMLGYDVGIRNSVDLVNSQKNYYQTFQTYQQSRYQFLMAEVRLNYLSGNLDEQFLQRINSNIRN